MKFENIDYDEIVDHAMDLLWYAGSFIVIVLFWWLILLGYIVKIICNVFENIINHEKWNCHIWRVGY